MAIEVNRIKSTIKIGKTGTAVSNKEKFAANLAKNKKERDKKNAKNS